MSIYVHICVYTQTEKERQCDNRGVEMETGVAHRILGCATVQLASRSASLPLTLEPTGQAVRKEEL